MDYSYILQRAFTIATRHRELWLYGVLSALLTVVAQTPNVLSFAINGQELSRYSGPGGPAALAFTNPALLIFLGIVVLVLVIVAAFVSLFSNAAIIGMAGDLEKMGTTSIRRGWHHGFPNFLRFVAIYLIVGIPFFLALAVVGVIVFLPLILLASNNQGTRFVGIATTIGLGLIAFLVFVAAVILLSIAVEFMLRACVVDRKGVFGSVGDGLRLLKENFGRSLLMWIIMLGVGILTGMLSLATVALLGGIAGILTFLIWQVSAVAGVAVGIVLGVPALAGVLLVTALINIFNLSAWTLAYLRLAAGRESVSEG